MSQEMTKEQIEQELNKQFEQSYTIGYVSGLKSVLPFIELSKQQLENLSKSVEEYLKEHDPHYGKDSLEIAQVVKQLHDDVNNPSNTE